MIVNTIHLADAERFNRAAKIFFDSGEVSSPEEAMARLTGFSLTVCVGPEISSSPTMQAALLTIVNTAARSFLGGVFVALPDNPVELCVPYPGFDNLSQAVCKLGGQSIVSREMSRGPVLILGTATMPVDFGQRVLRVTFDRWTAAVSPVSRNLRMAERDGCVIAGVLAGALAVSEIFQYLRGRNGMAAKRAVAISLWAPDRPVHWDKRNDEPEMSIAPDRFWLIGLGNLGQAYLWTLGLIPYTRPADVRLMLQDIDVLSEANLSTSVLTSPDIVGCRKTRAMSEWAARRGFGASVIERRFASNIKVDDDEPSLAFCGIDNALGRRALENAGFGLVLEAGLGAAEKFLSVDMHTFPGARRAQEIWDDLSAGSHTDLLLEQPGYKHLSDQGMDQCGLITLASKSVGVPFVGVVAASLVVSAAVRHVMGQVRLDQISLNLATPDSIDTFQGERIYPSFNPGYQALSV